MVAAASSGALAVVAVVEAILETVAVRMRMVTAEVSI